MMPYQNNHQYLLVSSSLVYLIRAGSRGGYRAPFRPKFYMNTPLNPPFSLGNSILLLGVIPGTGTASHLNAWCLDASAGLDPEGGRGV